MHLCSIIIPRRCSNRPTLQKLFRYFPLFPEYSLALLMSALYAYFTFFWKYDFNCPVGYVGKCLKRLRWDSLFKLFFHLGPGGLYDNMYYPYCTGGAARYIDALAFTSKHSYNGFFGSVLYDPGHKMKLWHDPEGLLGTTNSIVLTLIGLQAGHILVYNHEHWARFRKWLYMSLSLGDYFIHDKILNMEFCFNYSCYKTVIFHLQRLSPSSVYWPFQFPLTRTFGLSPLLPLRAVSLPCFYRHSTLLSTSATFSFTGLLVGHSTMPDKTLF